MSNDENTGDVFASGSGSYEEDVESGSGYEKLNEVGIRHLKLYRAALSGDWSIAEDICKNHRDDMKAEISKEGDTVLHIAAAAERTDFVKKLVENIKKEYLTITNKAGNTAFCLAAVSGNVELAQVMMNRMNKEDLPTKSEVGNAANFLAFASRKVELSNVTESTNLATIRGRNEMLPLYMAALFGRKEMVQFLYEATDDKYLKDNDRIELLITLISNGLYDVSLDLLKKHPELATASDENKETALHVLARMPITNERQQGFWKAFLNIFSGTNKKMPSQALLLVERIWEQVKKLSDESKISKMIGIARKQIFVAAKQGNIEFLIIVFREYPDLVLEVDENKYSIFHFAVMHRHRDIFKLIYEIGSFKDLIVASKDKNDNNILHLAGMLAPADRLNVVSGAALQLQRELLWFKEVNKIVHPLDAKAENRAKQTPRALFSKKHKGLKEQGEKWMKDTANYCMIVAALIATVVFAAAFTIPGGTEEETGTPHFVQKTSFKIFVIADAISLVSSSCSILNFLSILTSRYAEEDFLSQLPKKLVAGLATLLLSIAAMMVVFCATMFIVFKDGVLWVPILVTVIAFIPVFLFTKQQCRLFYDVVRSTYKSSSLFQSHKGALFYKEGKEMESKKRR